MRTIVQGFTCTPMPKPMPVVMYQVILEFSPRCRSLPQFKIQPIGYGYFFSYTNGWTIVGIPGSGIIHLTYRPTMHLLYTFDYIRPRSPLITHLDNVLVLVDRRNQQFTFTGIVSTRFLQVHMFAC